MSYYFTVIIPTFNRSGQLILSLTALEKQTFDHHNFEVIVVDDGSTDSTRDLVSGFKAPYKLTLLSEKTRHGPAFARNRGIKEAQGKVIIFCDADFLALPFLLDIFYSYHSQFNNIVVSGTPYCYNRAYTQYFPEFSSMEKKYARTILEKAGLWNNSYQQAVKPVDIITPADIRYDFNKIKLVLGSDLLSNELKEEFLKTDVAPWLLFITRCVSVEKEHLQQAGGFDERLVRGAGEDWELGYRLYRHGLTFLSVNKVAGFHQEHPHAYRNLDKNHIPMCQVLYGKYGYQDPELALLSIWKSSDDLWNNIPAYKNALRIIRNKQYMPKKIRDLTEIFKKACHRLAQSAAQNN